MKRKVFLIIFIGVIAILVWRFYSSGSAKKVDLNTEHDHEQVPDSPLDHEPERLTAQDPGGHHVPVTAHAPESSLDDDNSDNHMNYTGGRSGRYTNILHRIRRQTGSQPQREPAETLV